MELTIEHIWVKKIWKQSSTLRLIKNTREREREVRHLELKMNFIFKYGVLIENIWFYELIILSLDLYANRIQPSNKKLEFRDNEMDILFRINWNVAQFGFRPTNSSSTLHPLNSIPTQIHRIHCHWLSFRFNPNPGRIPIPLSILLLTVCSVIGLVKKLYSKQFWRNVLNNNEISNKVFGRDKNF